MPRSTSEANHPSISITEKAAEKPLDAREMIEWMEKSSYHYEILAAPKDMQVRRFTSELWPAAMEPIQMPYARPSETGRSTLTQYPVEEGSRAPIAEAEKAFDAKRYEEAAKAYEAIIKKWPNNYPAWTFWGEAAYFSGDPKTAITRYSKAVELNPYDHTAYFFRAEAYETLGLMEDAKADFAFALTLRPRYDTIQNRIEDDSELPFTIAPPLVQPKALARKEGDSFKVFVEPGSIVWMPFGVCKALWLADPKFRAKMTGEEEHVLSTTEELGCLANVVMFYRSQRRSNQMPEDPQLERLSAAFKEGWGTELFLYEIASRVVPHVMLTVSPESRERVRQYVLKYVLVPRGAPAKPAPVRGFDDGSPKGA